MIVRPAEPADVPALSRLLDVLFTQEAEFSPDASAQARGLIRIIENPQVGTILVACNTEQGIIGMVNLLWTVSTALGERVAMLEDMVVHPGARGRGVGSNILEHAIDAARAAGCRRITLLTDRVNEAAQRFYSRHGFAHSPMLPMRLMI